MTVIGSWLEGSIPILLGDTMLSISDGNVWDGTQAELPTRDDLDEILPRITTLNVTGLAQKVYIVSKGLILAWAGSRLSATIALKSVKSKFQNIDRIAGWDLWNFLPTIPLDPNYPLTLIGWIIQPNETIVDFIWKSGEPSVVGLRNSEEAFRSPLLEGTGQDLLLHHFSTLRDNSNDGLPSIAGLLGRLIHEEMYAESERFYSLSGGCYQLGFLNGQKGFEFLNDVEYLCLDMEFIGKEFKIFVKNTRVIRTYQQGDHLYVKTNLLEPRDEESAGKDGVLLEEKGLKIFYVESLLTPPPQLNNPLDITELIVNPAKRYCFSCRVIRNDLGLPNWVTHDSNLKSWLHHITITRDLDRAINEGIIKPAINREGHLAAEFDYGNLISFVYEHMQAVAGKGRRQSN